MNKYKILTLLFLLLSIGVESQALAETEQTQIQTEEEKIDIQLQNLRQETEELMEKESEQNSQNEYYLKTLEFHQTYLNAIFIEASKDGDIERLNWTLEQGADVDTRDQYGLRALMWATKYGHIDIVKILVPKVADIDARLSSKDWRFVRNEKNFEIAESYKGLTALKVALKEKNYEIAKVLLDNGADINARDSDVRTAFRRAIRKKNYEFVKVLLDNGADINARDSGGRTALVRASEQIQTVFGLREYLIEEGSDVNNPSREFENFTNSALEIVEIQIELMEFLIENGADVNARDYDGKTALTHIYSVVPTDSLPSNIATAVIELLKKHGATE